MGNSTSLKRHTMKEKEKNRPQTFECVIPEIPSTIWSGHCRSDTTQSFRPFWLVMCSLIQFFRSPFVSLWVPHTTPFRPPKLEIVAFIPSLRQLTNVILFHPWQMFYAPIFGYLYPMVVIIRLCSFSSYSTISRKQHDMWHVIVSNGSHAPVKGYGQHLTLTFPALEQCPTCSQNFLII
jgi:hypothetical protein